METFSFFCLRCHRAYDSPYDPNFWFSLEVISALTTLSPFLVKTSLNAPWNLKLAKKSLVNDKVTVPWSTRYASYAHYIHHSKQQKMNLRKLLGQQGFKTVKCNIRFNLLQVSPSAPFFVFALLFILSGLCSTL